MTDQDSSQRPYLVRAMHEWMTDNGKTPHVVIDANAAHVMVPTDHVQDGKIVLNCSYSTTKDLTIGNELIEFEARFSGKPHRVSAPMDAVLGIYARESGEGMLFTDKQEEGDKPPPTNTDNDDDPEPPAPGGPHLRIVK